MQFIRFTLLASFLFTALYHVAGIINPLWTEPSPAWRHGLFVAINLTAASLLYFNHPRLLLLLLPLVVQQIYGHTVYGLQVWQHQSRLDWASVAVCLGMPLLLFYIFRQNCPKKMDVALPL